MPLFLSLTLSLWVPLGWEDRVPLAGKTGGPFYKRVPRCLDLHAFWSSQKMKLTIRGNFLRGEWGEEGERLTISNEPQCSKTPQE